MALHRIVIDTNLTATQDAANLRLNGTGSWFNGKNLVDWMRSFVTGSRTGNMKVKVGAVQATGTITFSSLVADDTVTVNGVVFTAKASPSGANQFALGADDTAAAVNFAAKINASAIANIVSVLTATSALGVVTLTAICPGLQGNCNTIAISAHGSVSGSGRLTSGTDGTAYDLTLGKVIS
jgi:phage tail sheath gpL-like